MESETLSFSSESGIRVNDAGKTGPELRSPVPVHVSDDVEGFEGNDLFALGRVAGEGDRDMDLVVFCLYYLAPIPFGV